MSAFCAICAGVRGPFERRPLGRDGALVVVCASCDEDPVRSKCGPVIPYEVPDRVIIGNTLKAFARAANRVSGDTNESNLAKARGRNNAVSARPGFVVVRVRRHRPAGGTIDAKEARATLRDEPWFPELRHLGSDRRYHLFERPDAVAARAARSGADRDPLAAIAVHKRGCR